MLLRQEYISRWLMLVEKRRSSHATTITQTSSISITASTFLATRTCEHRSVCYPAFSSHSKLCNARGLFSIIVIRGWAETPSETETPTTETAATSGHLHAHCACQSLICARTGHTLSTG